MKNYILGILLCFLIAIISTFTGKYFPVIGAPVIAIFIGMIVSVFKIENIGKGVKFTSKYILQLAVVLLGFGLNLAQILKVGTESLPIIISTILTALIISYFLQKILKLDEKIAILVGVGSSICGGSAIAATAPVIEANDEEIAKSISVIFLFNVIAAIIFPHLGEILNLTHSGFAVFAGTAINDTSSVTAATTTWDNIYGTNTLEMATVVKLTRTLAIIPITLALSLVRVKNSNFNIKKVFPYFILFFILASIITTMGLPEYITHSLKTLSKFFIVMAMGAIGINTNIVKLVKTAGKAILLGGICWISIIIVSLVMQYLLRLL